MLQLCDATLELLGGLLGLRDSGLLEGEALGSFLCLALPVLSFECCSCSRAVWARGRSAARSWRSRSRQALLTWLRYRAIAAPAPWVRLEGTDLGVGC